MNIKKMKEGEVYRFIKEDAPIIDVKILEIYQNPELPQHRWVQWLCVKGKLKGDSSFFDADECDKYLHEIVGEGCKELYDV